MLVTNFVITVSTTSLRKCPQITINLQDTRVRRLRSRIRLKAWHLTKKNRSSIRMYIEEVRLIYMNELFQLLPHHFLIFSGPYSSYSALVKQVFSNSEVTLNKDMPFHASRDGSAALTMLTGISCGSKGLRVLWSLGIIPENCDGDPVR